MTSLHAFVTCTYYGHVTNASHGIYNLFDISSDQTAVCLC